MSLHELVRWATRPKQRCQYFKPRAAHWERRLPSRPRPPRTLRDAGRCHRGACFDYGDTAPFTPIPAVLSLSLVNATSTLAWA